MVLVPTPDRRNKIKQIVHMISHVNDYFYQHEQEAS